MFEGFIRNARTDRYNIMFSIDAHEKINLLEHDDGSSCGGYPLLSNSTTEALYLLGVTIYVIGCGIKALEQKFLECCHMYIFS